MKIVLSTIIALLAALQTTWSIADAFASTAPLISKKEDITKKLAQFRTSRLSSTTQSRIPGTMETAKIQLSRLFDRNIGSLKMTRKERFARIIVGWSLLLIAKSIALASPLFFRALVNEGKIVDGLVATTGPMSLDAVMQASALGLILGLGSAKLAAGFVQLICELILSSATVSAAEALPQEAFSAALASASRRWEDGVVGAAVKGPTATATAGGSGSGKSPVIGVVPLAKTKDKSLASGAAAAAGGQDEGRSGFARRALDRGLRASNQFLYRTIFNLLPSFVESFCVVCLMIQRAGLVVGLTAGLVAYTFVGLTMFVMHKRIPVLRSMLRAEGIANGCAEDALSLAETVASFGATKLEENRYADALARVSRANMKVRYTFSFLKLSQTIVNGLGAALLIYVTWKTATDPLNMAAKGRFSLPCPFIDSKFFFFARLIAVVDCIDTSSTPFIAPFTPPLPTNTSHSTLPTNTSPICWSYAGTLSTMDSRYSVAGQLVLVQSLYAQLCAPLDHVGQHFRDAVSAAEDLRDLESLKRVLIEASGSGSGGGSGSDGGVITGPQAKPPKVSRQPGGRSEWMNHAPRLQVNNLIFSYPKETTSTATSSAATGGGGSTIITQTPILRNVSFSIPAGGYSLGIVGLLVCLSFISIQTCNPNLA